MIRIQSIVLTMLHTQPNITVRELPVEEYHRLPSEVSCPPEMTRFAVAEKDGEIIAYWRLAQVIHLEPIWIHPNHRKGFLVRRLWKQVLSILDVCGISSAFCFSDRDDIADYVQRLGLIELPYRTFQLKR
jgi:hypothetical protein